MRDSGFLHEPKGALFQPNPAPFFKTWKYFIIVLVGFVVLVLSTYLVTLFNTEINVIASTSIEVNIIDSKNLAGINGGSLRDVSLSSSINSGGVKGGVSVAKRKVHIPKFMFDLYEERKRNDMGMNFSKPDLVRSVIPKRGETLPGEDVSKDFEETHVLVFEIPVSYEDEIFFYAELRILTLIDIDFNEYPGVERFIRISYYNETTETLTLLHSQHLFHSENTWLTFNMTKLICDEFDDLSQKKSLKLVISVEAFMTYLDYKADHFKLSLLPVSEDIEHDYPILLLSYMTRKEEGALHGRKKREAEEEYEEESNHLWDNEQLNRAQLRKLKRLRNTCRRKQLYIDFSEIHYDEWIVEPRGYEAYQCTGKCFYPVAEHLSPTKHAIVQALMHSVAPSRASRSCCVPSKLDPISLLYVDEKGIPTYRYSYKDMVVLECGCR